MREANVQCLRNVGAVKMLIPFLDASDEKFSLNALFGLAYLCDENESQIFQAKSELVAYMLRRLKAALHDESKKSGGLSLFEMTRGALTISELFVESSVLSFFREFTFFARINTLVLPRRTQTCRPQSPENSRILIFGTQCYLRIS